MPQTKRMNLSELIQHIPEGQISDQGVKFAGLLGGSVWATGLFPLSVEWVSATGQFMGGLAAILTIAYTLCKAGYTIYKAYKAKKTGK